MKPLNGIGSRAGTWVPPCDTSSNLYCVPKITALGHPLVSYSCYCNFFLAHMSLASLWNGHTRPHKTINKVSRHVTYCFHLACEFCYPVLEGISFLWHNVFMADPCLLLFFSLSSKHLLTLVYFTYSRFFFLETEVQLDLNFPLPTLLTGDSIHPFSVLWDLSCLPWVQTSS